MFLSESLYLYLFISALIARANSIVTIVVGSFTMDFNKEIRNLKFREEAIKLLMFVCYDCLL